MYTYIYLIESLISSNGLSPELMNTASNASEVWTPPSPEDLNNKRMQIKLLFKREKEKKNRNVVELNGNRTLIE